MVLYSFTELIVLDNFAFFADALAEKINLIVSVVMFTETYHTIRYKSISG